MSAEFETARMKARKLAALAARGVGGERETAQHMLARHLKVHGLSLRDLADEEQRQARDLDAGPCPAALKNDMTGLLANCLAFVLQHRVLIVTGLARVDKAKGRKRAGKVRHLIACAELTQAELEDWKECFEHYRPAFLETRKRLHLAARKALDGFLSQHNIFAPSDGGGADLSPEELEALIAAMRASSGETWQRTAKLAPGNLLPAAAAAH
jgi:hypothetical protein